MESFEYDYGVRVVCMIPVRRVYIYICKVDKSHLKENINLLILIAFSPIPHPWTTLAVSTD